MTTKELRAFFLRLSPEARWNTLCRCFLESILGVDIQPEEIDREDFLHWLSGLRTGAHYALDQELSDAIAEAEKEFDLHGVFTIERIGGNN